MIAVADPGRGRRTHAVRHVAAAALAVAVEQAALAVGERAHERQDAGEVLAEVEALAALALYASLAYTVQQRRAELAVRRAVGASNGAILRLVVREGLGMVVVGMLVGSVAAFALRKVLQAQVYGVATADAVTFLATVLVLGAAAVAACVVPVLRALRTDPVLALRQ